MYDTYDELRCSARVSNHYIAFLHKYVLHITSSALHDIAYTYVNLASNDINMKLMNPDLYEGNKTKLSPDGFQLHGLGAAILIGSQQMKHLS
jgi:hypothetical protein